VYKCTDEQELRLYNGPKTPELSTSALNVLSGQRYKRAQIAQISKSTKAH